MNKKFKMSINFSVIKKIAPFVGIAVGGIVAYKVYQNRGDHTNSSMINTVQSEVKSLKESVSEEVEKLEAPIKPTFSTPVTPKGIEKASPESTAIANFVDKVESKSAETKPTLEIGPPASSESKQPVNYVNPRQLDNVNPRQPDNVNPKQPNNNVNLGQPHEGAIGNVVCKNVLCFHFSEMIAHHFFHI